MPTRSPRRVEQLSFLLRREPTVRSTGILERRCSLSLSLSKNLKFQPLHPLPFAARFGSQIMEKIITVHIFVSYSLNFHLISSMSLRLGFFTLGTISAIHFHHLSTLATCVTRVHVIGDFGHITCLSNPFYGTGHPVPRKT